MGKKGGGPTTVAPDPNVSAAAAQARDISGQEWDWFKNTYLPEQQAQQQTVQDTSNNILSQYMNNLIPATNQAYQQVGQTADQTSATALQQMGTTADIGNQIYQTWDQSYAPLYGQIASTAAAKGGQADQDYQAMMARGDVAQQFANAQGQNERYMAQYGLNPASGTALALNRTSGLNEAAQSAAAQTAARQAAANLGWTYQTQAAQIGEGLLSAGQNAYSASQAAGQTALGAQQTALNAGTTVGNIYNQALTPATTPITTENSIASGLSTGAQGSSAGITNSTTPLTTQENTQAQQAEAQNKESGSMFGSLLGAVGTIGGAVMGGPVGAAVGSALGKVASNAAS